MPQLQILFNLVLLSKQQIRPTCHAITHLIGFIFKDDFKPASIDTSCEGELHVGKGDEVTITLPHIPVQLLTPACCVVTQKVWLDFLFIYFYIFVVRAPPHP